MEVSMSQLGYACINMHLSDLPKSQRVTTNRSMIKRTFQERGLPYASELALADGVIALLLPISVTHALAMQPSPCALSILRSICRKLCHLPFLRFRTIPLLSP